MSDENYHEGDSDLDWIVFESSEEACGFFSGMDGARPNTREALHNWSREESRTAPEEAYHPLDESTPIETLEEHSVYYSFVTNLGELEEGESREVGGIDISVKKNGSGRDLYIGGSYTGHFSCNKDLVEVAPRLFQDYFMENFEH